MMCQYNSEDPNCKVPEAETWVFPAPYLFDDNAEDFVCECDSRNGWVRNEELDDGSCINCNSIHPGCSACEFLDNGPDGFDFICTECKATEMLLAFDLLSCVPKIQGCIIPLE